MGLEGNYPKEDYIYVGCVRGLSRDLVDDQKADIGRAQGCIPRPLTMKWAEAILGAGGQNWMLELGA